MAKKSVKSHQPFSGVENLDPSLRAGPLLCREKEFEEIYDFLSSHLRNKTSEIMYISGVPGTGKTATVTAVIRKLMQEMPESFQFAEVNGMRLIDSSHVFVQIMQQLKGKKLPPKQANQMLEKEFTGPSTSSKAQSAEKSCVLLVDELDLLCTGRQDVVYQLFDWSRRAVRRPLVILALANTMDLPERQMENRVANRLGKYRLTFEPYKPEQLLTILTEMCTEMYPVSDDAMNLCARKVASVNGDLRSGKNICMRAIELAKSKNEAEVTLEHVHAVLQEMNNNETVMAVRDCSNCEKCFLRSVLSTMASSGVEEVSFEQCFRTFRAMSYAENLPELGEDETLDICFRLSAFRILMRNTFGVERSMKLRLYCEKHNVEFALNDGKKI